MISPGKTSWNFLPTRFLSRFSSRDRVSHRSCSVREESSGNLFLAVAIIAALVVGKFIAAYTAGRIFGYPPIVRLTMWSLTLPQVAATLAAALVAFDTVNKGGNA